MVKQKCNFLKCVNVKGSFDVVMVNYYYYYYHLFVFKIIRTVAQLFTSVDKSNYKVHISFNKNKFSSSLRFDS